MKILFIALRHEYGDPARGMSFEQQNFYSTLIAMDGGNHTVVPFAFDDVLRERGKDEMNQLLIETARRERPDLCFFFLFTNEITKKTLQTLRTEGFVTFNWFADDQWRWFNFSRHYAPLFSWFSTTDRTAYERYLAQGLGQQVIRTQWACNQQQSTPFENVVSGRYDVTFVGQAYGERLRLVDKLRQQGINLTCFGNGWPSGRVDHQEMVRIFKESKINLNFSGSSAVWSGRSLVRVFVNRQGGKARVARPWEWWDNLRSEYARLTCPQLKGRLFEVPAAGGFLLTGYAPYLEEYYVPGKELAVFRSPDELVQKIIYYLAHDDERQEIARSGQERTLREHTYEQRLRQIFKKIGLD
jgi:spore maturation protein CgeB